jgi:membrane protease YdiL (CAAX protease family)
VSPAWYVVAIGSLPVAALLAAVAVSGIGPIGAIAGEPMLIVSWLIGLLVAAVLVNYWEELGWTGFVLHRLQPRLGPIGASVVTTWLQGALHLPLVFIAGGVTDGRVSPDQYPLYMAALFVLPIPVRIVLTWLYNRSGNSLPVVGLFHAGLGIASGSAFLPAIAPGVNSLVAYAGFAVLAAVILVATRGSLGYAPAPADTAVRDAVPAVQGGVS